MPAVAPSPTKASFPPSSLVRPINTGPTSWSQNTNSNSSYSQSSSATPRLRPNRSLATSPISPTFSKGTNPLSPTYTGSFASRSSSAGPGSSNGSSNGQKEAEEEQIGSNPTSSNGREGEMEETHDTHSVTSYPSNIGRPGIGTIPRTIPLNLNSDGTPHRHQSSQSVGSVSSNLTGSQSIDSRRNDTFTEDTTSSSIGGTPLSRAPVFSSSPGSFSPIKPLIQTATGTRYGVALTGGVPSPIGGNGVGVHMTGTGGSPRKWGSAPTCHRCGKSVYFAEQVKAVGKTFHKNCLRCVDCSASLDSNRLRDHDGEPYCVRCYQKVRSVSSL